MPPISVLIKPASDQCNMRCEYCFYSDVSAQRETSNYGLMTTDTLEQIVKQVLESATGSCTFAFQGGEPTLVGLPFFRKLIQLEEKYNTKKLPISHGIQTNGYLIDREWAAFFKENHFLVGLSLDGTKEIHNSLRVDKKGEGTFSKVMRTAQLLESAGVEFNILTVVTTGTEKSIVKLYNFFKRNGFLYQQYIPCLEPFGETIGGNEYSLTSEKYASFLKTLFNLWHRDVMQGTPTSVRYFDNLVGIVAGYPPESCDMRGNCSLQYVIEADGSVYPCDFYSVDEYKMGTMGEHSFSQMASSVGAENFLQAGQTRPAECGACRWAPICRGGCRRNWEPYHVGEEPHNYYCEAYQDFFAYAYPKLVEVAKHIIK